MQRECKFCENGQMVEMEKDEYGKWIVTNLDGTQHRHVKSSPGPSLTQAPKFASTATTNQAAKEAQEARNKQIIQAHDENIEASAKLTAAVTRLADTLTEIEKLLSLYVQGQQGGE